MGLLAYDSFTGAYNTLITAHTPEVGGAYTIHPVTSGQVARLAWDMVYGATAIVVPGSQPIGTDYSIEIDHLCQFIGGGSFLYARADAEAPLTGYYFEWKNNAACSIKRYIAGAYNGMSASYNQPNVLGQKVRLRLSVADEGGDVRLIAYVNGVEVISWLDDSESKITTPGVAAFKTAGANTLYGVNDNLILRETDTTSSLQLFEGSVKHVYQRDSVDTSVTTMTFRGAYNGNSTGIEVQILDAADGTTVVQDWTALSSLTLANGYFSGMLSVPNGSWYIAKARFTNEITTVSTQANKWGIGVCILTFGQSNMANMFMYTAGTQTPDDKLVRTDYVNAFVQNANWQGACPMGNEIVSATGLPVCLIDAAVSGSSLEPLSNSSSVWLDLAGVPYTRIVGIHGLMPKIEAGFFAQGEQEARTTDKTVQTADYVTNMDTLFGRIRTLFGDANLPIFVTPLIVNEEPTPSDVVPEKWNYIRWGHMQVIDRDDDCFFGGNGWDQSMSGGVHYSNYNAIGYRTGLAYTRHLGLRSFGRGPKVVGYTPVNSTTFDIKIQHDGGTDISPASGITGFRVYDDTTLRTITSATRQDAETVRLVVDSAVTTPKIYHVFGCITETPKTAPLIDNTTAALPLWPSDGAIALYDAGEVDDTAPILTSPTATATSATTATASVTTDDGNGTLYFIASTNATESASTVKAALSQSVTTAGAQSISLSALNPGTTYYVHFVQINGASLESASVVSTAAFTTDATAVKGATITLHAGTTPQASIADIVALWWDATTPSGAPAYSTTTASTDASGVLTLDLDAVTALSIGDSGFLLLYKPDATDHRNSLVFAGRVAVSDIA